MSSARITCATMDIFHDCMPHVHAVQCVIFSMALKHFWLWPLAHCWDLPERMLLLL